MGLLSALIVGNLALNGKHYGPNNVVRVNLAMYLLLADVLSHWAESLVETATLADRAAATPFLPRTEALAPYVGRQRRTAAVFVKRNFIAQVAVTTVSLCACAVPCAHLPAICGLSNNTQPCPKPHATRG